MYVFNTWLIANLFHPLIYIFFCPEFSNDGDPGIVGVYLLGFIYSFIFSLPFLLLAFTGFYFLKRLPFDGGVNFCIWLGYCVSILFIIPVLIIGIIDAFEHFELSDFAFMLPSAIAVTISILIRYRQFFTAISVYRNPNTEELNTH